MAEATGPTKGELLESLESSGRDVVAALRGLAPERFDEGRYENGWNAREILAHIATIEWSYPRLIEMAKAGPPAAESRPALERSGADSGLDTYNQRWVDRRAEASVADLLEEFAANRQATIAAVSAVREEDLLRPVRSAAGATGSLARVLYFTAVTHVQGHVRDIVGGA